MHVNASFPLCSKMAVVHDLYPLILNTFTLKHQKGAAPLASRAISPVTLCGLGQNNDVPGGKLPTLSGSPCFSSLAVVLNMHGVLLRLVVSVSCHVQL